jgi:hypothetical protein
MYYVLSYLIPQDENGGYFEIEDGLDFDGFDSWSLGRRWPNAGVPDPIEVDIVPVDGYSGQPSELYDGNMCLMSARLVDALLECGVDNLELYRAVLRNVETGKPYDYRAVNIIGLVSAADLTHSSWERRHSDPMFDVNFDSIVIDERRAGGRLMFRLAENTGVILIDERIRDTSVRVIFQASFTRSQKTG